MEPNHGLLKAPALSQQTAWPRHLIHPHPHCKGGHCPPRVPHPVGIDKEGNWVTGVE